MYHYRVVIVNVASRRHNIKHDIIYSLNEERSAFATSFYPVLNTHTHILVQLYTQMYISCGSIDHFLPKKVMVETTGEKRASYAQTIAIASPLGLSSIREIGLV